MACETAYIAVTSFYGEGGWREEIKGQLLMGDAIDISKTNLCGKKVGVVGGKILKGKLCRRCQNCSEICQVLYEVGVCNCRL